MTSQFTYKITEFARFLLPIYQIMSAGFVDKSGAKCWHRWLRFCSENLIDFITNLLAFCYLGICFMNYFHYQIFIELVLSDIIKRYNNYNSYIVLMIKIERDIND